MWDGTLASSASFPPATPVALDGRIQPFWMELVMGPCWSVINGHGTNTAGRTDREGREGGNWLDSRSCRRGFQGWLRVATRGLGNSREVQQTPLGRNPRKKLSLLFPKNTGNQWGMETNGNFQSPCKMKHPIKWSSLGVTGNAFIWTFAP